LGSNVQPQIALWGRSDEVAAAIVSPRRNAAYLSEIAIDASVAVSAELGSVVEGAAIAILAVRTHAIRDVATAMRPLLGNDTVVVSAAKGFETGSGLTMTAVLRAVLGDHASP